MCLISLEDLRKLHKKTLIFFAAEEDDQTYIEDSYKIVAGEGLNELVKELRLLDVREFPIICYDNEDLSLASRAYWIFDAMDFEAKILVTSRGLSRPVRSLGPTPHKEQISHIDITKISNSVLYQTQEFNLLIPIVPNIIKDLSQERVQKFLEGQQIPVEIEGTQLNGFYAEQIAALLRYLDQDVTVLLAEVKSRTKTVVSKFNETFVSIPESVYYDAEEDMRSRKSEYMFGDLSEKNYEKNIFAEENVETRTVEDFKVGNEDQEIDDIAGETFEEKKVEEQSSVGKEKSSVGEEKRSIKEEKSNVKNERHYSNGLDRKNTKENKDEEVHNQKCFCLIL